jgi:hypothetical protein
MYKIEIWQHHTITEKYESDNIEEVLHWYKEKWWWIYEIGDCAFYLYKDGSELSFTEEVELGFHN